MKRIKEFPNYSITKMDKDEVIAAKNKYIDELRAEIEKLKARLAADREYQMKQVFH